MGWVIFGAVTFLALIFTWLGRKTAPKADPFEVQREAEQKEYDSAYFDLFQNELAGYVVIKCRTKNSQALLAIHEARNSLKFLTYRDHPLQRKFEVHERESFALSDLISAELTNPDKHETYWTETIVPVHHSKNKNALLRGAVGAAALGPAGLILGVASALTPTTVVRDEVQKQKNYRIVQGPSVLQIALANAERDSIVVTLKNMADAEPLIIFTRSMAQHRTL